MGFLMSYALTVFYGIFGLYALEKYDYGPDDVGVIFMVVGLVSAITQGVLTGPLTMRWGEAVIIKISLLLTVVGFMLFPMVSTNTSLIVTIGLFTLATSLLSPAVSALTSKQVDQEHGVVMGISNAVMSLGRAAGPLWAGISLDIYLELPYLSSAAIMLAGFVISLVWLPGKDDPVPLMERAQ
jgi:DHA1 family multidrug resistance protein-like MFS transporter